MHLNPRPLQRKSTSTPGPFKVKAPQPPAPSKEKHLNPRPLLLKEKGRALSLRRGLGEVALNQISLLI
jgi:hypothetical protein